MPRYLIHLYDHQDQTKITCCVQTHKDEVSAILSVMDEFPPKQMTSKELIQFYMDKRIQLLGVMIDNNYKEPIKINNNSSKSHGGSYEVPKGTQRSKRKRKPKNHK